MAPELPGCAHVIHGARPRAVYDTIPDHACRQVGMTVHAPQRADIGDPVSNALPGSSVPSRFRELRVRAQYRR